MSTQRKAEFAENELSEDAICDYLVAHPDFFENHKTVLSGMQLPHASGGTVSLVERQISLLRQKDLKLERQLKDLIRVARDNDVIAAKIHELSLQLMAKSTLEATIVATEEAVRSGFAADQAVLVLFCDPDAFADINAGRFFVPIRRDDDDMKPFATFLNGNGPRCGQARDSQMQFLFRDDAQEIGSVALVPLGDKADIGFLVIGSNEADRFHPDMSIDFLARVGDLVAVALKRF